MSIKNALDHIINGNLDAMRSELSASMTAKAIDRLEEKKLDIANSYFGKK
jgi:hypothetical protein